MSDPQDEADSLSPAQETVLTERFIPSAIVAIANTFSYGGSMLYWAKFGVRVNDWRVLNKLLQTPGAYSVQIMEALRLDKAVVSRSVGHLKKTGLIRSESEGAIQRLYVTPEGVEVHQGVMPLSLAREKVLTGTLSDVEHEQLLRLLLRVVDNLAELKSLDSQLAVEGRESDIRESTSIVDQKKVERD